MLTETEQTFETIEEAVEHRRDRREQAAETQEPEAVEETEPEESAPEEIEAEADAAEADQEISEDDPSEELDLEASEEDSDEVDETEAAEETPALPAVEPPQHLKGNEREQFTKLTPEAQAIVANLAKNGEALVTKKSQELSQSRQQLEQRLEGLGDFVGEKESQLQYYENVDWVAAAQQLSPQEYQQHKAAHESLKAQVKEAKETQSRQEVEDHKTFVSERTNRLSELSESNPIAKALTDSKDGISRQKEVFAYMHENGMERDTLLWVPAEGLTMAYKAMMYDRANKKAKELPTKQSAKPNKPAPKTVKATSSAQGSSTNQRLQTLSRKSELTQSEFTEMRKLKRAKRRK